MAFKRISSWSVPVMVAGGAAAAAATVAVLIGGSAPAPDSASPKSPLHIVYFQPAEPEIQPGSVMDVGPVVDGYVHRPAPPPTPPYVEAAWLDDGAAYEPETFPPPQPPENVARVTVYTSTPQPSSGRRFASLGFDDPRPDYAEARRQREIERDRRMADRRETSDRPSRPDGPPPGSHYEPDDAFF